ncbi:DgyrCDS3662 [Dimorphilus gyrociliatus]|uniref:DgyrCDS3662 n=1 Tax=Dimorphilus gyrociliatus TaxID=2664684 RepID=A0A7I8VE64_9ANNE|nr:DgyrCDS3662 [Dimorphilus gyrociliatus]
MSAAATMQWSSPTNQTASTTLQNAFPSFQIDSTLDRKGDIRVKARAPSGRITETTVREEDGMFTANFQPTEVGDWLVSILYDGVDIEGSPFSVRVYDAAKVKIGGLEGGVAGKSLSFSADCTGAGEGSLSVEISHEGVPVPVFVDKESPGIYKITFTPSGAGRYSIQVLFANIRVPGSPFTVEIVDASKIEVSGEGITTCMVGQYANFLIHADTPGAKLSDLSVEITAPNGITLPSKIQPQPAGYYRVEYIPKQVGEHLIDVAFMGRPVGGSPFRSQAFDPRSITLSNLSASSAVGRPVEFDIDASRAGSGNLEIMVNDGQIKCAAQDVGNKQFHAVFVPINPGLHHIRMKFNGIELPASPWTIEIKSAALVQAFGIGLTGPIPCQFPTSFDVNCGTNNEGVISANVISPNKRSLPVQVTPLGAGVFRLTYTPLDTGIHTIDVNFEGSPIPNSPFKCSAYDTSLINFSEPSQAVVGKPVDISIDVSSAGNGNLAISVNGGQVPNTIRKASEDQNHVYIMTFVPKSPVPHMIDMTFNDERVPRCPVYIPVIDTNRVSARGEGLSNCTVNSPSTFQIDASAAGEADLSVTVTAPDDTQLPYKLTGSISAGFEVTYTPFTVGKYHISIIYGGVELRRSPFVARCSDASKITVSEINDCYVGKKSSFIVNAAGAGEGNIQISIGVQGRNIKNIVQNLDLQKFEVLFTPDIGDIHEASVTFNSVHITGSPFKFRVFDAEKLSIDGNKLVQCNEETSLTLKVPAIGYKSDLFDFAVTDPEGRKLHTRLEEIRDVGFKIFFTPIIVGNHDIRAKFADMLVQGCPFVVQAFDSSKVIISEIEGARVGEEASFKIDPTNAGKGNLEIQITANDKNVHNDFKVEKTRIILVTFTPEIAVNHIISVKFNGHAIQGCPLTCPVTDSSVVSAYGEGLKIAAVQRTASFVISTAKDGRKSKIDCEIISPDGKKLHSLSYKQVTNGFLVEYVPKVVGRHVVEIKVNDVAIPECPFYPEIYDVREVKVGSIGPGVVGKPTAFHVNCQAAGEGTMTVDVRSENQSRAITEIEDKGEAIYEVTFIPRDNTPHSIVITFNNEPVVGSPFLCQIGEESVVASNWNNVNLVPVSKVASFNIDPSLFSSQSYIKVKVVDPRGIEQWGSVDKHGNSFLGQFVPTIVGTYSVSIESSGQILSGSTLTYSAYDASKVEIIKIDSNGKVGDELGFTVDTSKAGAGDLDVEVNCSNQLIRTVRDKISNTEHRYRYIVQRATDHEINVLFNLIQVPGCPKKVSMADPGNVLSLDASSPDFVASNQTAWASIKRHTNDISVVDLEVKVQAPNGEKVPAKLALQADGNYKVEYSSIYTGEHTIEVRYADVHIAGTPFRVQIFDPNKVKVEVPNMIPIGQRAQIAIHTADAGLAEMGLTITTPRNEQVNYEQIKTDSGYIANFTAFQSGVYKIYVTYGGLNVPGCPISMQVEEGKGCDAVTVIGEGLYQGVLGKQATFKVDTQKGELLVKVDGPNGAAKCHVEPHADGKYSISYVPAEVGTYQVVVKLNGQEVPGSPWKPNIVSPSKVEVTGGWQSHMDPRSRIALKINEPKEIEFDVTGAGSASLAVDVRGPAGSLPVEIKDINENLKIVRFTPQKTGEHYISVSWGGIELADSPLTGFAISDKMSTDDLEKVILTGRGLQEATVHQEAFFQIDGSAAGPGSPDVKIVGVTSHVDVNVTPLGNQKYRCSYVPSRPGAYLLNVKWGDRDAVGSPFKINVSTRSDAKKVQLAARSLQTASYGKEISTIIDTKGAGPGQLTAHCMGPNRVAYCDLIDQHNGTFKLKIKTQEAGKHILQVKYCGEHIPGSPFEVKVQGAPDPSKVKVSGPGIQHGILATFLSRFLVDTTGAGAGELLVRVRGPKGAFNVTMSKENPKDRVIICKYHPTEVGEYLVYVRWSNHEVSGSPFKVQIFDSADELQSYLKNHPNEVGNANTMPRSWAK